ncbi:MAG: SWIM zinc finger family protein [Anaerolineales bacterium]|nr:SWIM zinc finger family protein [Anaerolineales bacterium]
MPKRRKRRDYDDYGYGSYGQYRPPRKPAEGIKAKSTRGGFAESWWAKRWIATLEGYGIGSRLQRGRSYARAGQVIDIKIGAGSVSAQVQGSMPKPYRVKIALPILSDPEWERVIDAMSAQAIFAAKLLAGEMPNDIEEAFKSAKVSLFPAHGKDLITDCSCPDYANPCKHIAAVYYLLGEQFDTDPFLIFTPRGRSREQVIAALRQRRTSGEVSQDVPGDLAPIATSPLQEADLPNFWKVGNVDEIAIHLAPPEVRLGVLKRLGSPPDATQPTLEAIYTQTSKYALDKVLGVATEIEQYPAVTLRNNNV